MLRAAPFEIVTSAPPRYTLQGKLVVEALEASYTPVTTVYNSAGKKLTVVRCVARKGETFEVPFTLQVNFDGQRFGEGAAPPLGRAVGDFGAPLASFVNGFDVATEVGRRLRDAPKVVAEAEQAVRTAEVSLRKTYLDLLKKALDNNASLLDELGALKGLYPETDDMFSHSFAQPRGKVEAQIREFLAPRFSADYEKFYGEYDAAKQRVEETKRFLDDL
ncbi:MAG TPA: hypothetical protein VHD62_09645 [Opitutaceae bacterium]|nr:hypothetical protein [Opitutaceae bacterium]